jgi:hypothetical protein
MHDELFDLLIELLFEGLFVILEAFITSRKEKSELQKLMKKH